MVMEKVFHEKSSEEKNITRIFFSSGTNILRNKYTLTVLPSLIYHYVCCIVGPCSFFPPHQDSGQVEYRVISNISM